ncbi:MAG TPA: zinc ABC transporter substrate-binding protein [Gordonia sp. (in: high G+C Gram-positive bacteria)]|uniref:metal ABC transporter solute-binding protein, Zn/Mn family n=1 Tax=unclassified Gordonia (in: high G+C Gram-positive bacteria) TaxID=2657482 RepID=UPI000FA43358|nr:MULTISPECIES: zinc ABC transporter substrate-binding protein [unclassified Gordonia (in: high G+C Gram-positive bacteria)]RUP36499.1 MAG: ABC transporter substrate-binding protein [Gordonia sp. (in: high G+C Gram-positive bacteria)]HNP57008.1 zinc ABC transporter substrate-binding protein [Gordonia sp. (in: high G+C Gram-positive bacteria)]HRC50971.1 zinc ABC transporter substrate-binding protein [Gordonia sp. (in: high G+C Gram-positive bacteria)]
MRHRRRLSAAVAAAVITTTAVLSGCSDGSDSTEVMRPLVVTSTNVWGAVAQEIVGANGTVKALYISADGDPHDFTPSAVDSAAVADADIVLINGGHYDEYLAKAKKSPSASVIDAASLIGVGDGAHDEGHGDGGHDDDGHADHPRSSDGANEHVFYSLTAVRKTADALAVALARHSPAHAADYRRNAAAFGKQLDDLQGKLAGISARHRGAKVAQTEPLAGYLITAAGLVDASPPGFTAAVENGQSPSAADRAKLEDLLTSHTAKALLYNAQAVNPVTTAVADTARRAGVPVVTLTESLPVGVTTYAQWQGAQIDALARALGS